MAPIRRLDAAVQKLADRIAGVPKNQLMMLKLMINQSIDAMGLEQTQMFAAVFDGITRHSPEGLWFKRYAETYGFPAAVEWRDSGRPIPEPGVGNLGDTFMVPPAEGARSQWSRDVSGKRSGKRGREDKVDRRADKKVAKRKQGLAIQHVAQIRLIRCIFARLA